MRARIVGLVVAYVRKQGGDADALLRGFGLPHTTETDDEVVLSLTSLHAFLDAAEKAIDDPFLGLHVAIAYRRGAYGVMEYACRSSPTLRDALIRVVRFSKLMNDHVEVTLDEKDGAASIQQKIASHPLCVGRHANEFFVATLLDQARHLSGQPCIPLRAWFAHPKPKKLDELITALGTDVIAFDAEANGFSLPSSVLDLPILTHDPSLLGVLDNAAQKELAERPAAPDFVAQVRRAVRERMRTETPTLENVASDLGMSARTLQRRLSGERTTFLRVHETVREELARAWVADPKMPLTEIAFLLGYAELSAFLRAFKRWTGQTPSQFRGQATTL